MSEDSDSFCIHFPDSEYADMQISASNNEKIIDLKKTISIFSKKPLDNIVIKSNGKVLDDAMVIGKNSPDCNWDCYLINKAPEQSLSSSVPDPAKVSYLINLGYPKSQVENALSNTDNDLTKAQALLSTKIIPQKENTNNQSNAVKEKSKRGRKKKEPAHSVVETSISTLKPCYDSFLSSLPIAKLIYAHYFIFGYTDSDYTEFVKTVKDKKMTQLEFLKYKSQLVTISLDEYKGIEKFRANKEGIPQYFIDFYNNLPSDGRNLILFLNTIPTQYLLDEICKCDASIDETMTAVSKGWPTISVNELKLLFEVRRTMMSEAQRRMEEQNKQTDQQHSEVSAIATDLPKGEKSKDEFSAFDEFNEHIPRYDPNINAIEDLPLHYDKFLNSLDPESIPLTDTMFSVFGFDDESYDDLVSFVKNNKPSVIAFNKYRKKMLRLEYSEFKKIQSWRMNPSLISDTLLAYYKSLPTCTRRLVLYSRQMKEIKAFIHEIYNKKGKSVFERIVDKWPRITLNEFKVILKDRELGPQDSGVNIAMSDDMDEPSPQFTELTNSADLMTQPDINPGMIVSSNKDSQIAAIPINFLNQVYNFIRTNKPTLSSSVQFIDFVFTKVVHVDRESWNSLKQTMINFDEFVFIDRMFFNSTKVAKMFSRTETFEALTKKFRITNKTLNTHPSQSTENPEANSQIELNPNTNIQKDEENSQSSETETNEESDYIAPSSSEQESSDESTPYVESDDPAIPDLPEAIEPQSPAPNVDIEFHDFESNGNNKFKKHFRFDRICDIKRITKPLSFQNSIVVNIEPDIEKSSSEKFNTNSKNSVVEKLGDFDEFLAELREKIVTSEIAKELYNKRGRKRVHWAVSDFYRILFEEEGKEKGP